LARKTYVLALDDSGTRHPTHKIGKIAAHRNDWFSIGGVIFDEKNELQIRDCHASFLKAWNIECPLHSSEIRAKADNFAFIGTLETEKQNEFYEELYQLMSKIPVTGIACVIDRPGYCARYLEKYDKENRWLLCKSAFSICVERAAKFASRNDARLRVLIERSDKTTDALLKAYYEEMRQKGMPFSEETSSGYAPLQSSDLSSTLFEFRLKEKTSPLMQLADLYLWPMCMGGYNKDNRPFKRLWDDKKLVDRQVDESNINELGIKYYCFKDKKPS